MRLGGRERAHSRDSTLDEPLPLIAAGAGDETEVIVGDQPLTALVGERADDAMGHRLGVRGGCGSRDHGL